MGDYIENSSKSPAAATGGDGGGERVRFRVDHWMFALISNTRM